MGAGGAASGLELSGLSRTLSGVGCVSLCVFKVGVRGAPSLVLE